MIELLVVIAIIAILAAILLPTLSRAKERAHSIQCMNHLKQLHIAWHSYATEYMRLPRNWNHNWGFHPDGNWVDGAMTYEHQTTQSATTRGDAINRDMLLDSSRTHLAPYLQSADVFKCPSDRSYFIRDGEQHPRVRSYSMNQFVGTRGIGGEGGESTRHTRYQTLTAFDRPSERFVFLEEHEDSINDGFFFLGDHASRNVGWNDVPASRHRRGANFIFADGHAEYRRWEDSRTVRPVTRERLFAVPQPESPDVHWVRDHATTIKDN